MNIDVTELSYAIHTNAKDKGFWDENNGTNFYLKQLAMIHSEVTEILEAIRKEKGDKEVLEEMADVLIRVFDLYAGMRVDGHFVGMLLENVLMDKVEYNTTRPKMHGVLA